MYQEVVFKDAGQAQAVYRQIRDAYQRKGEDPSPHVKLQKPCVVVSEAAVSELEKTISILEGKGARVKIKERRPYGK